MMKQRLLYLLITGVWILAMTNAQAAISCTVSSPGFLTAYSGSTNNTQTSLTVTCNRNRTWDPTTLNYSVGVNNGLSAAGGNRARLGATTNYLNYDAYKDASCLTLWGNSPASTRIPISMSLSAYTPTTLTVAYWGCLGAAQIVPAGTYTDTVSMTVYNATSGNTSIATGTFPVSITAPATCGITAAPTNISLNYLAFGPAVAASTSFGVTCTRLLYYALALDVNSAVLTGVNYTLALSASSATGTGFQQSYTITATAPAGQAGTCPAASCTASQVHTLTVTY